MTSITPTSHSTVTNKASDIELVIQASLGNSIAFELIMRRYNRLLFRTARSILKNDAETEDALQEAYVKAWRAMATFRDEAKLSTWLVRIVVNEALGRLRRRSAQIIPLENTITADPHHQHMINEDVSEQPEHIAMNSQMRRLLETHIDALPDTFRTVFVLRAVEELSVEEVATVLAIPEATVRSRFFRARGLLREGLAHEIDVATADAFSFDGARCDRIVASVLLKVAQLNNPVAI